MPSSWHLPEPPRCLVMDDPGSPSSSPVGVSLYARKTADLGTICSIPYRTTDCRYLFFGSRPRLDVNQRVQANTHGSSTSQSQPHKKETEMRCRLAPLVFCEPRRQGTLLSGFAFARAVVGGGSFGLLSAHRTQSRFSHFCAELNIFQQCQDT